VAALETPPPLPATAPDQGGMIIRYAILNGALELLPENLATMAIVPLQMKMVYRIGKAHGAELDRSSIRESLATAGLGLGSQMLEGFARKWIGGLGKKAGGKKQVRSPVKSLAQNSPLPRPGRSASSR